MGADIQLRGCPQSVMTDAEGQKVDMEDLGKVVSKMLKMLTTNRNKLSHLWWVSQSVYCWQRDDNYEKSTLTFSLQNVHAHMHMTIKVDFIVLETSYLSNTEVWMKNVLLLAMDGTPSDIRMLKLPIWCPIMIAI